MSPFLNKNVFLKLHLLAQLSRDCLLRLCVTLFASQIYNKKKKALKTLRKIQFELTSFARRTKKAREKRKKFPSGLSLRHNSRRSVEEGWCQAPERTPAKVENNDECVRRMCKKLDNRN